MKKFKITTYTPVTVDLDVIAEDKGYENVEELIKDVVAGDYGSKHLRKYMALNKKWTDLCSSVEDDKLDQLIDETNALEKYVYEGDKELAKFVIEVLTEALRDEEDYGR